MHRRPNFITHWAPYKYCKIYQRWNFAPKLRGKVPPSYSVMRIKTHRIHHLTLHINLSDGYIASPQTSFGVRLSRIHFSPTDVGERWMRDKRTLKDVCGEANGYIALQRDSRILKFNLSTSLLQLLWVVPLEHKAVKDGNSDCAIVTKGFEALDRILGGSRKLLSSLPSVSQWFPEKPSLQWHT